jgi:hypothetical protein
MPAQFWRFQPGRPASLRPFEPLQGKVKFNLVSYEVFDQAAGGFRAAWASQKTRVIGADSMYPRNAASPQRIAIGAVVLIATGAVQTSGVLVKVMPQGGAAVAGGGTIAYEEGVVHYVPTQAETNFTSFVVIAYKVDCIPVSAVVVTSASNTAGYAGLDWSAIRLPTTAVNLSATTVGGVAGLSTANLDAPVSSRMPAVAQLTRVVAGYTG